MGHGNKVLGHHQMRRPTISAVIYIVFLGFVAFYVINEIYYRGETQFVPIAIVAGIGVAYYLWILVSLLSYSNSVQSLPE